MAFLSARTDDIQQVGSGERFGTYNVELSSTVFEDGLKVGRFAKLDTGSIDNMDGSATPSIAGIVTRNMSSAIEQNGTIDASIYEQINYIRSGLCTVAVKSGETPSVLGRVYVSNAGNASDGLATATNTDVPVNAEFIREIQAGVWLVYLAPPPGDIADHIGDPTGAHAASAISLLDSGNFTTAINVETAIAELYPKAPVAIANVTTGQAIPVTRSATIGLTSTVIGGETRSLATPSLAGTTLIISFDVDGGDIVITSAVRINLAGNTIITLKNAGESIGLAAIKVAGALVWSVMFNNVTTALS